MKRESAAKLIAEMNEINRKIESLSDWKEQEVLVNQWGDLAHALADARFATCGHRYSDDCHC